MTLKELKKTMPRTISVPQAAEIMGVSPKFIRAALMQEKFPFGVAVKMDQNEFYINTLRFLIYMEGEDIKFRAYERILNQIDSISHNDRYERYITRYNEIKYISIKTNEVIFQESGEIEPPSIGITMHYGNKIWKLERIEAVPTTENQYVCYMRMHYEPSMSYEPSGAF